MICDDVNGNHWAKLSNGDGTFKDLKHILGNWCGGGALTKWADINGDGKADILCDDVHGNHWARIGNGDGTFTEVGKYKSNWCKGHTT
jgi:hypothetical protein